MNINELDVLIDKFDNGTIDEKSLILAFKEAGMTCRSTEWVDDVCGGHIRTVYSNGHMTAESGEYGWTIREGRPMSW